MQIRDDGVDRPGLREGSLEAGKKHVGDPGGSRTARPGGRREQRNQREASGCRDDAAEHRSRSRVSLEDLDALGELELTKGLEGSGPLRVRVGLVPHVQDADSGHRDPPRGRRRA